MKGRAICSFIAFWLTQKVLDEKVQTDFEAFSRQGIWFYFRSTSLVSAAQICNWSSLGRLLPVHSQTAKASATDHSLLFPEKLSGKPRPQHNHFSHNGILLFSVFQTTMNSARDCQEDCKGFSCHSWLIPSLSRTRACLNGITTLSTPHSIWRHRLWLKWTFWQTISLFKVLTGKLNGWMSWCYQWSNLEPPFSIVQLSETISQVTAMNWEASCV